MKETFLAAEAINNRKKKELNEPNRICIAGQLTFTHQFGDHPTTVLSVVKGGQQKSRRSSLEAELLR